MAKIEFDLIVQDIEYILKNCVASLDKEFELRDFPLIRHYIEFSMANIKSRLREIDSQYGCLVCEHYRGRNYEGDCQHFAAPENTITNQEGKCKPFWCPKEGL